METGFLSKTQCIAQKNDLIGEHATGSSLQYCRSHLESLTTNKTF